MLPEVVRTSDCVSLLLYVLLYRVDMPRIDVPPVMTSKGSHGRKVLWLTYWPGCQQRDRGSVPTEGPCPHGRELASELRRIRLVAGMSNSEVARRTGLSQSSVSQLENGQLLPSADQVDHWAHTVGVSERVRKRLRTLAEDAATEVITVRHLLRPGPAAIGEDVGRLEASSTAVHSCEPLVVPGLLQTPEYAKWIMGTLERPGAELVTGTTARMARQALLRDPVRGFEFILTEYGLRWSPIGMPKAVLYNQLSHIGELAELPNVSVGVIGMGVQTKLPLVPFFLYEQVQGDSSGGRIDVVMLETPAAMVVVTDPWMSQATAVIWLGSGRSLTSAQMRSAEFAAE